MSTPPVRDHWHVSPFTTWRRRRPLSTDPFHGQAREIHGARIQDDHVGVVYECTVERTADGPKLTAITILAGPGTEIDAALMRRTPVQRLAEQTALFLAAAEAATQDQDLPPLDEYQAARLVNSGETRQTIALKYGLPTPTVDRWIGKARRAGLLPEATTGRPRKETQQ